MAQVPFQPILSKTSAPTYVSPGVQDNTTASLVSSLGGMAVEAFKGYNIAELEKAQEATINAYVTGDVGFFDPESAREIQAAGDIIQEQSIELEKEWSSYPTFEGISVAEQKLASAQMRMATALEQGRITADEFNARMTSNLREAINRTPGLEAELVAQTKRVMEYSGMSDFMKIQREQQDFAKKQQDQLMAIYTDAIKQANVDPANFNGDIVAAGRFATKQLQEQDEVKRGLDQLKILQETNQLKRDQVDQLVASPDFMKTQSIAYGLLHSTLRNNFESGAYLVNKPSNISDVDANILGVQRDIESQRSLIRGMKAAASQNSRPVLDDYEKQLDALESTYREIITGKFTADEKKARLDVAQSTAKLPFAQGSAYVEHLNKVLSGLEHMKTATGTLQTVPESVMAQYKQLIEGQLRVLQGYDTSAFNNVDISTAPGQQATNMALAFIAPDKAIGLTKDQAVATNSRNVKSTLSNINALTDATKYTQITDMLVEHVNANTVKLNQPISNLMDTESAQQLAGHLERSIGNIARIGVVDYDAALNKLVVKDQAGKVNQQATDRFNKMFRAMQSIKGFTGEVDIDKYGEDIKRMAGRGRQTVEGFPRVSPEEQRARDQQRLDLLKKERDAALNAGETLAVQQLDKEIMTTSKSLGVKEPDQPFPTVEGNFSTKWAEYYTESGKYYKRNKGATASSRFPGVVEITREEYMNKGGADLGRQQRIEGIPK